MTAHLCLGIDPVSATPENSNWSEFENSVKLHTNLVRHLGPRVKHLKPNLAFFIRHGSKGLGALESFVDEFKSTHNVTLDAKFGEISNTLHAYLDFAFKILQVQSLTLNPFLGEKTLIQGLEMAIKHADSRARIYILCATSEGGQGSLSFLSENWKNILTACVEARNTVLNSSVNTSHKYSKCMGVVVGANRTEVLKNSEIQSSQLSILSPGIGAQGASESIMKEMRDSPNEILFPLSRGVFAGGLNSFEKALKNFESFESFLNSSQSPANLNQKVEYK